MPKGIPNKRYSGEFKQKVVEMVRTEGLSCQEAMRRFEIGGAERIRNWERIYLEEDPGGLYIERRGRASVVSGSQRGHPPKLDKQLEEDLIAENQRLRAENDYLKNLQTLVLKDERHQHKKRR